MASSYGTIKKGASGDTVKWIQEQLGINADGQFGSQTEQAVRNFQSQNGIRVDGIVGNETMEYLINKGTPNTNTAPNNNLANQLADYEGNRPTYAQSQALTDAAATLARYEASKPGAYQSKYADQIQNALDQILNREKFSYDFASDPMYQQYADRYQQQGKLAMMDAIGQAAALTGGYGSSYGQQVGQQTYQGYLQGLNDIIPELRDAAYQVYQDEGNTMRNNLGLLQGMDDVDYGRYRDTVSDYYNDLNYYYGKYNDMSTAEYNRYLNDLSAWQADRAYYYGKQQDAQAQSNWEKEYALAANKASGGSGSSKGSSGSSKGSSGSKNPSDSYLSNESEPTVTNSVINNKSGDLDRIRVGMQWYGANEFAKLVKNNEVVQRKNADGTITYLKSK